MIKPHVGFGVYFDMTERERIGQRITELRDERGMTIQTLADLCGMQRSNISRIESGKYSTGIDILAKIGEVLNVHLDFVKK